MNTGSARVDRVLERSFIVIAWWMLFCLCAAAGAIVFGMWKFVWHL